MTDADRRVQELANITQTKPEIWLAALKAGIPFRELQERAVNHARLRTDIYRELKRRGVWKP